MLAEDANSLLRGGFEAMEWQILVDDFLHPPTYGLHVSLGQGLGILLLEIAVVAIRNRVLNEELAAREDIADGLVKDKAKRANIHATPRTGTGMEELHIAVLEEAELEALRNIVHLG